MPAPRDPEKRKLWKKKISETLKRNPIKPWQGKHRSEETRRKISESLRGHVPWNKGKTFLVGAKNPMWGKQHSEETRRKISEKLRGTNHPMYGQSQSEETKQKRSESLRGEKNPMWGKHHSSKTKRKISEANKGRISWHKDKTGVYTEETIKRMSNSHKGRIKSEEERMKLSKALTGRILSEETKGKISASRMGQRLSEKTKKKLSIAGIGRKLTKESKRKISKFHKGRPVSPETRRKISQTERGKSIPVETRLKMSEAHRGAKNYNWKGGTDSLATSIRHSVIYKLWREAVFIRDRFQCQDCGRIGGNLHAHHTRSFVKLLEDYEIVSIGQAIRTEELWDVALGVTLCIPCHKKRHKKRSQTLAKEIKNFSDSRHTPRNY